MQKIKFSQFPSLISTSPLVAEMTLEEISTFIKEPIVVKDKTERQRCFSLNIYHPKTSRSTDGVDKMTGLVLDFDCKEKNPDHITNTLFDSGIGNYQHVWYTTFSHTQEKPHWRLLLALKNPVQKDEWPSLFDRVLYLLKDDPALDPVGAKVAQIYYWPYIQEGTPYQSGKLLEGDPLDLFSLPTRPQKVVVIEKSISSPETPLTSILEALQTIDPDLPYDEWISVGMALKDQLGESGFSYWNDWSQKGAKYPTEKKLHTHWKSFQRSGKTISTLFGIAKSYDRTFGPTTNKRLPIISKPIAFLQEEDPESILSSWEDLTDWHPMDFNQFPLLGWVHKNYETFLGEPREKLSLGATVGVSGFLLAQHYKLGQDTNFYIMNLANPGFSKDRIITISEGILNASTVQLGHYTTREIETAPAFVEILAANEGKLFFCVDEISDYIGGMRSKNASTYKQGVSKMLKELFSGARYAAPITKSNMKDRIVIDRPFISANFFGTPTIFKYINLEDFTGGFLSRFLIFYDNQPDKIGILDEGDNWQRHKMSLKDGILHIASKSLLPPEGAVIEYEEGCREWLNRFLKMIRKKSKQLPEEDYLRCLFARLHEQACKLSKLTVIREKEQGLITLDGVKWATSVALQCFTDTLKIIKRYYGKNQYKESKEKVLGVIRRVHERNQTKPIRKRDIIVNSRIPVRVLDEILKELQEEEIISFSSYKNRNGTLSTTIQYHQPTSKGDAL